METLQKEVLNSYFLRQIKFNEFQLSQPQGLSAPRGNGVWRTKTITNWQLLLLVV
jgi:hypothetical protein